MASVLRGSGDSSFGGNLSIEGVLTYEDVSSVDSVGIVTARSGLHVGTGASIFSPDTNELALGTNNTQRLTVASGGNIGVKNTAPNNTLTIGDGVQTSYAPSTAGNYLEIARTGGADAGLLINKNTGQWLVGIDNSDGANSPLRFEYGAAGSAHPGFGAGTLGMIIASDGDIGIGVDNPTYKVSVKDTKADGTGVQLHLWNNSTDNVGGNVWSGIRFTGSTADYETAEIKGWRSHPGTGLNSLSINTGGVERMVLSSSGVGIGTNSPFTGAQLTVDNSGSSDVSIALSRSGSGQNDVALVNTAGEFVVKNGFASNVSNLTERMRINAAGAIVLPNGSPGIQFGTFSSPATSTTLDDYEEGSWTPTLNKAGTTGVLTDPTSYFGFYRKVGGLLFLSFYVYKSSGSFGASTGAWYVSGIPFNIATLQSSAYQFIMGGYHAMNGLNFNFPSNVTGGGEASGSRWQANNVNGSTTLTLYGMLYTTNWSSGGIELSGCGVLML